MPNVFACYPSYEQPVRSKVHRDPRSRKRSCGLSNDSCLKKKQETTISSKTGDPATTDDVVETKDAPTAAVARTVKSSGDSTFLVDDLSSVASAVLSSSTTSEKLPVFKGVARDHCVGIFRC